LLPLQQGAWARVRADGQAWPAEPMETASPNTAQDPPLAVYTVAPHQLITLRSTAPWGAA
jgi:hypothetical protein